MPVCVCVLCVCVHDWCVTSLEDVLCMPDAFVCVCVCAGSVLVCVWY